MLTYSLNPMHLFCFLCFAPSRSSISFFTKLSWVWWAPKRMRRPCAPPKTTAPSPQAQPMSQRAWSPSCNHDNQAPSMRNAMFYCTKTSVLCSGRMLFALPWEKKKENAPCKSVWCWILCGLVICAFFHFLLCVKMLWCIVVTNAKCCIVGLLSGWFVEVIGVIWFNHF